MLNLKSFLNHPLDLGRSWSKNDYIEIEIKSLFWFENDYEMNDLKMITWKLFWNHYFGFENDYRIMISKWSCRNQSQITILIKKRFKTMISEWFKCDQF